jgi:hypothetical protein
VTYHPRVDKDMRGLHPQVQRKIADTIDRLAAGDPTLETHALTLKLKGWNATKVDRGHRIVHRPDGQGGIFVGYAGLHDYDKAINRLTSALEGPRDAIRTSEVSSHRTGPYTVYTGRVAPGEHGYRAFHSDEVDDLTHGWKSRGRYTTKVERGGSGSTIFSAVPLTQQQMDANGYTHQAHVDLGGLKFRTLREPGEDGSVKADMGLGLGITDHIHPSRIKHLWVGRREAPHSPEFDSIGADMAHSWYEDYGLPAGGK